MAFEKVAKDLADKTIAARGVGGVVKVGEYPAWAGEFKELARGHYEKIGLDIGKYISESPTLKNSLIGLGGGAGLGALYGLIEDATSDGEESHLGSRMLNYGLLGGGLGGAAGAALGLINTPSAAAQVKKDIAEASVPKPARTPPGTPPGVVPDPSKAKTAPASTPLTVPALDIGKVPEISDKATIKDTLDAITDSEQKSMAENTLRDVNNAYSAYAIPKKLEDAPKGNLYKSMLYPAAGAFIAPAAPRLAGAALNARANFLDKTRLAAVTADTLKQQPGAIRNLTARALNFGFNPLKSISQLKNYAASANASDFLKNLNNRYGASVVLPPLASRENIDLVNMSGKNPKFDKKLLPAFVEKLFGNFSPLPGDFRVETKGGTPKLKADEAKKNLLGFLGYIKEKTNSTTGKTTYKVDPSKLNEFGLLKSLYPNTDQAERAAKLITTAPEAKQKNLITNIIKGKGMGSYMPYATPDEIQGIKDRIAARGSGTKSPMYTKPKALGGGIVGAMFPWLTPEGEPYSKAVDDLNVFAKPDDTGAADQLKSDIKKNIDSTSDETRKLNLQALLRQVPAEADEKTRRKLFLQLMSIVGFNPREPVANP
jgi:hypothetical protein